MMKSLSRFLPVIAGAAAGAAIAAIISSGGGTKTVTQTTTVPAIRSSVPASFSGSKGLTINQLYKLTNPGVVDITTSGTSSSNTFGFGQQPTQGEGAGVVFDNKGDIITDYHVVQSSSSIKVNFPSGHSTTATVVGSDPGADVAVIHVNVPSSWLHPLPFADSSAVQVGDSVIAIGSPFSLPSTVTAGIVSATGRTISAPNQFTIPNAIQTDAPINPGNSGGPLINAAGQVIGLNDQIETNNQSAQGQGSSSGIGFATPSNSDVRIAHQIISTGKAQNAYVGVSLNAQVPGGAAISTASQSSEPIVPGGPAAKAGLQPGDLITAVDGKQITSVNQFVGTIANYSPGDTVTLTVKRGGQTKSIKLTLGAQPAQPQSSQSQGGGGNGGGGNGGGFQIPIP
jgi:putative serine protease PepD